jgi:hypothetical protein
MMKMSLSFAAVAAVAAAALVGCSSPASCPDPGPVTEYCFAWPLPDDAGTGGDPGACPDPTSQEASNDLLMFGKSADGGSLDQGVNVVGAGSTKQGQCCYKAQYVTYCE